MAKPNPKIHASTQKFTEIIEFVDEVVVLEGGNACMIIEITASNFALLSKREQETRIFSYAALLNSLSFPIQVLVRNKRMDISNYLKELDDIIKTTKNTQLQTYIKYYRSFVHEMVTVNTVLNKAFYIVVPFTSLEAGVSGVTQTVQKGPLQIATFAANAKKALQTKVDSLLGQLQKFAMSAHVLEREELIKLFYDLYNEGSDLNFDNVAAGVDPTMIKGETKT